MWKSNACDVLANVQKLFLQHAVACLRMGATFCLVMEIAAADFGPAVLAHRQPCLGLIPLLQSIRRTLPTPTQEAVERFRRQAVALGVPWPQSQPYGEFLRSLDRTNPRHLALIYDATGLFRGSAYVAFDGQVPDNPEHGALAAIYAHVTAPLRRLVDRFGLAVAEAVSSGTAIPDWARAGLAGLPAIMAETTRTANGVERACTDAVEAAVLADRVEEVFDAVVVDNSEHGRWVIQLSEPAVVAQAATKVRIQNGDIVRARLVAADIEAGEVRFEITERHGSIDGDAEAGA